MFNRNSYIIKPDNRTHELYCRLKFTLVIMTKSLKYLFQKIACMCGLCWGPSIVHLQITKNKCLY